MQTVEVKKVLITPELATEWLNKNNINRAVRNHWVDQISEQISDGNWMLTHQGIAFGKSGSLIDGQHRLMAIEKSNQSAELFVFFGIEDQAFKAIDSGIKRSMSDLTRLDRPVAEAATRLCKIVYSGRKITPEKVSKIAKTKFMQNYRKLMSFCPTKIKYYGSLNSRIAACLALDFDSPEEYVFQTYADLNHMNVKNLPPIAESLIKQVSRGERVANEQGDALARMFKVFSYKNRNFVRLTANDDDVRETYDKIKVLFREKYGMKD